MKKLNKVSSLKKFENLSEVFKMTKKYQLIKSFFISYVLILTTTGGTIIHGQKTNDYIPLELYYGKNNQDYVSRTITKPIAISLRRDGYRTLGTQGFISKRPLSKEGTAKPLYLYYSKARKDYFTTSTSVGIRSAKNAKYTRIAMIGYIVSKVKPQYRHLYRPMWLYYNDRLKDNFTAVGSGRMRQAAGAGYRRVRIEGYLRINDKNLEKEFAFINNPYDKLIQASRNSQILKSQTRPVKITPRSRDWRAIKKEQLKFKPFTLNDNNGRAIPPNRPVQLKNGSIITAKEFVDRLNIIERKLNAQGFSLRNQQKRVISKTITPLPLLSRQESMVPKPKVKLKTPAQLTYLAQPYKRVGQLMLKPHSSYTEEETRRINSYKFFNTSKGLTGNKRTSPLKKYFVKPQFGKLKAIKEFDKSETKSWEFGSKNTFLASVNGSLSRYAKIYPFNPNKPGESMSEFKAKASSHVKAALFNRDIDLLGGSAELFAPAKTDKKMEARIKVQTLGKTIFNLSKEFTQTAEFKKTHARSFDKSVPIEIPIGLGIDFKGLIGVKGNIGFEYNASLFRTFTIVKAKPLIDLKGYAEAGIEVLDVAGLGIGGNLTFVKGDLELRTSAGIWNQNSEEIVAGLDFYFGYNLSMLKGDLYAYLELCAGWLGCYRPLEHEFFNWKGFESSGTLFEETKTISLANIAEYEEQKVSTGEIKN